MAFIKHYNDIAVCRTLGHRAGSNDRSSIKYFNGLDIYFPIATVTTGYGILGYGVWVKKVQVTPGTVKKETVDVKYLQGTWNSYEPFEEYAEVTAWTNSYKAVITCKIPFQDNPQEKYNTFVNELHGKQMYWHIVTHDKTDEHITDVNTDWMLGTISVDKLTTGDAWTFTVTITGDMTTYTESEEETDE